MQAFAELESGIGEAQPADRPRLRKLLRSIRDAQRTGKPFDRNLARLTADVERSAVVHRARIARVPAISFDDELPISARRDEIAAAIRDHQVVIVSGETGSGKSTQLPKICLSIGRGIDGMIGHTQPRRIAARSVAARIADELHTPVGEAVGFKVRFTDATKPGTYIKLMTDGVLLAESQRDSLLHQYDTIIIDEAHERSLNIDFLIGYLKRILPRRPELKLIITSATIDAERFAAHFESKGQPAPVIEVSGRTYPVEVRYRPMMAEEGAEEPDWQQGVLDAVDEAASLGRGDMLIFMPTERDIHETAKLLRAHDIPGDTGHKTEITPLYARLSTADQNRIFKPHPHRRIVIATNVAESSLTVPGIRYVIDPGTARISRYSPRSKVHRLPIEAVSQASADQRKGRCGRVGPGVCLRLYSEADYLARERFTPPEIQRTNLASVILTAKAFRLGEIEDFPFLDPPKPEAVRDGYKTLFELGAIDEERNLTEVGKRLSRLPVDPRIGRIILAGHDEHCLHEILIIAAALETLDPRERPLDKQQAADEKHEQFEHEDSDFLSYLKLWDFYRGLEAKLSRSKLREACKQNFLSYNRLREWFDLYHQVLELAEQAGLKQGPRHNDSAAIHRALLAGLLSNVGFRGDEQEFTAAAGGQFRLWPGSGLIKKPPKWIVAAELVETSRRYVRTVARIDPAWIEPLAKHLVSRSYSEPHWHAAGSSVMAFERVALFGLTIVPKRRVRYSHIDPVKSRELFIQHGLVEGDFQTRAAFFAHNQQIQEQAQQLQAKTRRGDLLLGEEARFEFYDKRLPPDVCDGARLDKWLRTAGRNNPQLLFMRVEDLLHDEAEEPAQQAFPGRMTVRSMELPLEYRYDPGAPQDGVTISVPQAALNQLDARRLGWLVPGLLEEKVIALIKSLPKPLRRFFVPVPETAKRVLTEMQFGQGDLVAAVATVLSRIAGEKIALSDFQPTDLPGHLQINIRVLDPEGKEVAEGRNLNELQQKLGKAASATLAEIDQGAWSRQGLTAWDFDAFPAEVELGGPGITLRGYPALLDRGETVDLRLLDNPERAQRETLAGLRRLFVLANQRELKAQVNWLPGIEAIQLIAATLPAGREFKRSIGDLLADRAFLADGVIPRTRAEYDARMKLGRSRIGVAVQEIAGLLEPLLQAYQQAKLGLERLNAPSWRYAAEDIRRQLAGLVAPGFLTATPWPWLLQYPRYLRAVSARIAKLAGGRMQQDQRTAELLHRHVARYEQHVQSPAGQNSTDPQLIAYRWMLEEFRVSLFAQELGTSVPVSDKRLDKQWERIASR